MKDGVPKLTVPEVLPLAKHIYRRTFVGCCLHIVLDDLNVRDSHVVFCVDQARREGHGDCETLALLLLRMTKSQRKRIAKIVCGGPPFPDETA